MAIKAAVDNDDDIRRETNREWRTWQIKSKSFTKALVASNDY